MGDRLRALWDFADLYASEARFREQLTRETTATGRAEVLTQLARIEGLRGDFDGGERLLTEAELEGGATARVLLERGRLRRSAGEPAAALPLFESAYALALDDGDSFLAADAAHMAALAAPDRAAMVTWTHTGLAVADSDSDAAHWLGPLLNNLGWAWYDDGDYPEALDVFTQALAARERTPADRGPVEIARYAVGKTLRALHRSDEAIPLLESAVVWSENSSQPDGWFHEELALEYADVGRPGDARRHAERALALLPATDPSFANSDDRVAALRALAGTPS